MILCLCIVGLFFSIITFLAQKSNLNLLRLFPNSCNDASCENILFTTDSRTFFSIPNSLFAIIFFIMFLIVYFLDIKLLQYLLSSAALLFSSYLAYRLVWKHQVFCKICFASHLIILSLFSITFSR
jgi:uncharacterized membrane protein